VSEVLDYAVGRRRATRRNWFGIASLVMVVAGIVHAAVWYHLAHESGKNYMLVRAFWAVAVFNSVGVILAIVGVALPRRVAGAVGLVGNGLVGVFSLYEIMMLA
jgi:hypothetical protein